jgi:GDPmannose 4,6-dehydratase
MKILITGTCGQDGANMIEYLLKNTDALIYGMVKRSGNPNYENINEFLDNPRFKLVFGDLTDDVSINSLVKDLQPDYFINFGANSFVGISWEMPIQVFNTNTLGVLRCLEAIRRYKPTCRFYSAGSSEEMGDVQFTPQTIFHPIRPRSPYGASKASARHIVKCYRESYNLYAVHGILFNHEGKKRGIEFLTRKVSAAVARITKQLKNNDAIIPLELGNLDARRDWSDSEDFVEGIWRMINQEKYRKNWDGKLKEYILASGETHSIREFVEEAFSVIGVRGYWQKKGDKPENEVFIHSTLNIPLVKVNPKFYRPAEVDLLLGDSTPAREELGWKPNVSFKELVKRMVLNDIYLNH